MNRRQKAIMDALKTLRSGSPMEASAVTAVFFESPEEWVADAAGYTLTGMVVKKKAEGWMVMLKARDREGVDLVTFAFAMTLEDTMAAMCMGVLDRHLTWSPDKWSK